jgi:hypothetical protein
LLFQAKFIYIFFVFLLFVKKILKSALIKIYHSFDQGRKKFAEFLENIAKTMENQKFTIGLHYGKGEIFYSFNANPRTSANFESQFYTHFNNFQLTGDTKEVWTYDKARSAIGELKLMHSWFFPFKMDDADDSDFIFNIFRTFENFDVATDKA